VLKRLPNFISDRLSAVRLDKNSRQKSFNIVNSNENIIVQNTSLHNNTMTLLHIFTITPILYIRFSFDPVPLSPHSSVDNRRYDERPPPTDNSNNNVFPPREPIKNIILYLPIINIVRPSVLRVFLFFLCGRDM